MTFGDIRDQARRYARVDSTGAADAQVFSFINDSVEQFAIDVHGFPLRAHLSLQAKFDLDTTMGFHLKISGSTNNDCDTDVAATASDANEQTGTEAATELQSQMRAAIGGSPDLTVAWTAFEFTVDAIDATSIAITAPSDTTTYWNAVDTLFGGNLSGTSSVTSGFPEDCTIEADLPDGIMGVEQVWWDYYPLQQATRIWFVAPQIGGSPQFYHMRGNRLRVFPVPESQERFYIEYRGAPQREGSPTASSTIDSVFPEDYQRALAYKVASELVMEQWDHDVANRLYGRYFDLVKKYRVMYANRSTTTANIGRRPLWYDVRTE